MTRTPVRHRVLRAAPSLARWFCLLTGATLLVDTIAALVFSRFDLALGDDLPHDRWNFFFAFNTWHHLLHLVTSCVLLVAARKRRWAPVGALLFGAVYVVLTPPGFIDGNDAFNVIYTGWRENWVHAFLAVQGVAVGVLGLKGLAVQDAMRPRAAAP